MLFSSTVFLFLFLPIVLGIYFIIPKKLKNTFLLLASLFFYAWGETFFVMLMIFSIFFNYICGLLIEKFKKRKVSTIILILSIIGNLGLLGFFKYTNFIVNNINSVITLIKLPIINLSPVHLPIGISFFTFQAMTYVIDIYKNISPAQKNPINIALYISLFPQLIAGPIVRYHDIARQLLERSTTIEKFSYGIRRFIIGLGKKVLIANTVAEVVDKIFVIPNTELTFSLAWLGIICYSLQIYFDFSGYSDMAIGLGYMFGFKFLENFNYPYISRSIKEFWQRWHISLSTWFKDYLYIPLGGNRKGKKRTYFNLLVVFILCGFWHGASWNFLIWGLYHGFFLVIERIGLSRLLEKTNIIIRHIYCLIVVMFGWVFFRSDTLTQSISYIKAMLGLGIGTGIQYNLPMYLNNKVIFILIIGIIGSIPIIPMIENHFDRLISIKNLRSRTIILTISYFIVICSLTLILLISSMALASGTYNPFIYFRF